MKLLCCFLLCLLPLASSAPQPLTATADLTEEVVSAKVSGSGGWKGVMQSILLLTSGKKHIPAKQAYDRFVNEGLVGCISDPSKCSEYQQFMTEDFLFEVNTPKDETSKKVSTFKGKVAANAKIELFLKQIADNVEAFSQWFQDTDEGSGSGWDIFKTAFWGHCGETFYFTSEGLCNKWVLACDKCGIPGMC